MSCPLADLKAIFPKQACDMNDTQLVNLFNYSVLPDLQKYIYKNYPNEFVQSTTIPMVNGVNSYTIPPYAEILSVTDNKCNKACEIDPVECSSKNNGYYIAGDQLVVSPTRNFTSLTIKYMKPLNTSVTSPLSPLPFSSQLCMQLKPIIADYLLAYYFRSEGMMDDANKYLEQANTKMDSTARITIISIDKGSSSCKTCKCENECH